jgi:hypothetical protein
VPERHRTPLGVARREVVAVAGRGAMIRLAAILYMWALDVAETARELVTPMRGRR